MGGLLGAAQGMGTATEHQKYNTPHTHGEVHIACMYQFGTLASIAQKISKGLLDPKCVLEYQSWLHEEEPLAPELHEEQKEGLEKEWWSRLADPSHHGMSTTPVYLTEDHAPTMWDEEPVSRDVAVAEGSQYKKPYFEDVQFIFSSVQHHIHKKTLKGYLPLKACLSKHGKKGICKGNFPKEHLQNTTMRVICAGNAKRFRVRISGRRNSFGCFLGRRTCMWQSGTTPGFAAVFRSNSHTQPNHRLPPTLQTHDAEFCKREGCVGNPKLLKVALL